MSRRGSIVSLLSVSIPWRGIVFEGMVVRDNELGIDPAEGDIQ